jgi:HEAT repeat protein
MSETDSLVELARQKAQSERWTPQKVINELDPNDLYDRQFIEWCNSVRSELVPGLKQALWEKKSYSRVNIGRLLLELGEPDGLEGIIDCLRSNDSSVQVSALVTLAYIPKRSVVDDSPLPINQEAIFTAVEPFLNEPDSHAGGIAVDIALNLTLPQAEQRTILLLQHRSPSVRVKVASEFLRHGKDNGALDIAENLILDGYEINQLMSALESCAKGENRELAMRAADILLRYILANLNCLDNGTVGAIWSAMRGLEAVEHPEEAQTLRSILSSPIEYWARGTALQRLGELEGEAGIVRLQNALADPQLRQDAAEGIAKVAKRREDAVLIDSLTAALQQDDRSNVLSAIIDALIAVGADAVSILAENTKELDPYDAMRVAWISKGITPKMAAKELVEAVVIRPPEEELLERLEEDWQRDRQPSTIIFWLLDFSKRLTGFDCETSIIPVDHVELIEDLMEIGSDVFQVEAISESWQLENEDDPEAILGGEVQFVCNRKLYRFNVEYLGDWYDVNSVLKALNSALEESGRSQRFMLLYTGDQTCLVIFAPVMAFLEVADRLHIPIEEDPESAMERGVAYEQYVIQKVREESNENNS